MKTVWLKATKLSTVKSHVIDNFMVIAWKIIQWNYYGLSDKWVHINILLKMDQVYKQPYIESWDLKNRDQEGTIGIL